MKTRKFKIRWIFYTLAWLLLAGALYLWFTGAKQNPTETGDPPMQAAIYTSYGGPEALTVKTIKRPTPNEDQVLIKVRAASANPLDWHILEGKPYVIRLLGTGLRCPLDPRLGVDLAGVVEAVGKNVTQFKPGDEVFGTGPGAFAEYVCARPARLAKKPANITFEEAAGVPVAGLTALQALRDKGEVHPGEKILINGASGGVGTFAVQIAKAMGAEVTGVCSGKNVALVRSLGAESVIDYTREDFSKSGAHYDVILDNVGSQPLAMFHRVLTPEGRCVLIGGGGVHDGNWIGALSRPMKAFFYSLAKKQKFVFFLAEINQRDLEALGEMMATGKVKTVIDRTYPLAAVAEAMRYLEQGHARGKVIITMPQ